jgi:hypothetical protein
MAIKTEMIDGDGNKNMPTGKCYLLVHLGAGVSIWKNQICFSLPFHFND